MSEHGFRKYDQAIGRFTSIDPLWEKYPSLTPYQYSANSPLIAKDPGGDDIIVLLAPKGASGLGHVAVLIGNEQNGWRHYSHNGGSPLGVVGEPRNIENGVEILSLSAFYAYNKMRNAPPYVFAYHLEATAEQDAKMAAAASKAAKSFYVLTQQDCLTLCAQVLKAGGFDPGYASTEATGSGYSTWKTRNLIPKQSFWDIVKKNPGGKSSLVDTWNRQAAINRSNWGEDSWYNWVHSDSYRESLNDIKEEKKKEE